VGRRGVYLGGEFDGGERDVRWLDSEITGGGSDNGERWKRSKKERRRNEASTEPLCPEGCEPR
jgi:hypothetical protein